MKRLGDILQEERKLLGAMRGVVSKMRELSSPDIQDVAEGSARLRRIRSEIYENLNQVQHEYVILQGLHWLASNGFSHEVVWEWNPRQTGGREEPDLRGTHDGRVAASAEATASQEPKGGLDSRMRDTLEKLTKMEGEKFYFVCAHAMAQRAQKKVRDAGWRVRVVNVLADVHAPDGR